MDNRGRKLSAGRRLPLMTLRSWMAVVALAAAVFVVVAEIGRRDQEFLEVLTSFAILEARRDLGDLSQFEVTAKWVGGNAQIDFVPRIPHRRGKRYLIEPFLGEVRSTQPLEAERKGEKSVSGKSQCHREGE